jgi:D-aminopeptidase
MARARLRELGIVTGILPTGPLNAITDVAGVRVGYATLVRDAPTVVRTGVRAATRSGPTTSSPVGTRSTAMAR